jgi:multiple sugar transport system permease protein
LSQAGKSAKFIRKSYPSQHGAIQPMQSRILPYLLTLPSLLLAAVVI